MPVKLRNKSERPVSLAATHANVGVQTAYYHALEEALNSMQMEILLELSILLNNDPPQIGLAQDVREIEAHETYEVGPDGYAIDSTRKWHPVEFVVAEDASSPVKRLDTVLKRWGDKWRKKFDKLSPEIARRFAASNFTATQTSMQASLRRAGFIVSFKPTRKSLEAFRATVADNVGLIRNLQQSYYNRIQQDVWASVRKGADMHALSQKLQQSYGITTDRAALIARDQNNKAKATIENTRRKQLGITQAVWQHSAGGKEPRPSHVKMNGKLYDLNKGMWDEDEREFVFPGELINCRCTSRAIIPGFHDDDV